MAKAKGSPKTGGRQKGTGNKVDARRRDEMAKVAQELENVLPDAFTGDSHALLMAIYKDTSKPLDIRLDAAKAAIGYEKPRLAATEARLEHSGGMVIETGVPTTKARSNGHAHPH